MISLCAKRKLNNNSVLADFNNYRNQLEATFYDPAVPPHTWESIQNDWTKATYKDLVVLVASKIKKIF